MASQNNPTFTKDGETRTSVEWQKHFRLRTPLINQRLLEGMSLEEAVTTPVQYTIDGVTKTIDEWSETTGVKSHVIYVRINQQNWKPEKAITTPPRPPRNKRKKEEPAVSAPNTRKAKLYYYKGKAYRFRTLFEMRKDKCMSKKQLTGRLSRDWQVEKAVDTPLKSTALREFGDVVVIVNGISKTVSEWADAAGVDVETIKTRVDNGLSHEEAVLKQLARPR
jgi:hypothetical protein